MNVVAALTLTIASVFSLSFHNTNVGDDAAKDQVGKLRPEPRHAEAEIASASEEGQLALGRMKLPAGLTATLWAAEPMLANPVAFNFDERGRIFVTETYRYRSSTLDIRDYMWTLEDELANRTLEDNSAGILRHFGRDGVKALSVESERVRLLEDTNHDGKADRSTVFAEGFNSALDGIAAGVLARRGKVYLTSIPSLWLLENETPAGVASKRTELSRGYGIRFNVTGHDLHGLVLGPDGKLYFSVGDRAAHAVARDGSAVDAPDTGSVFRCNLDGTQLEIFATGLRNPQSLFFNEYGDLFTGDNDSDLGDQERLIHVVQGGDSGWRIGYQYAPLGQTGVWNIEKLWQPHFQEQAAYLLPPICNIEDGPSGIAYYPGTGLNESYRGGIFISHFKGGSAGSGIYLYKVKPEGASYAIADSKPFLSSSLPTDVKFGPDGKLYYSDWSEGWAKSKKGRIYAISDPAQAESALVKETQALIASDFTQKSNDDLAKLLGHADWRVRLEAQYSLAERGEKSISALSAVAAKLAGLVSINAGNPNNSWPRQEPELLGRLHAIWGLGQVAEKFPAALGPVRPLVSDPAPEVRAQAIKVLGDRRDSSSYDALVYALKDENSRVKFFAAQSLGKLGYPESAAALLEALNANRDEDVFLRHALVVALASCKNLVALSAAVTDSSRAVRLGALLAFRRLGSPEVVRFLDDSDPLIVAEAARAINDTPIDAAMSALAALITSPRVNSLFVSETKTGDSPEARRRSSFTRDRPEPLAANDTLMLRVLNANFRLGTPERAGALARYAARADVPAALRVEALTQLKNWAQPSARDRVVGIYRPLTPAIRDGSIAVAALRPVLPSLLGKKVPPSVQAAAIATIETLKMNGAGDLLFAVVAGKEWPTATRSQALVTLSHFKHPRLREAVRVAEESHISALRLSAMPIAANLEPQAAAPVVSNLGAHGDVAEQKAAFEALGTLHRTDADATIVFQLRELLAGKIAPEAQLELVEAASKREDPTVKKLLSEYNAALAKSGDPLAPYLVALKGGNAEKGRKLFHEHPALACIRCHKVGDQGGDAGPSLTGVGGRHPREYLLESIVKPSAKIAAGFENATITLKSGMVQAGMIVAEDDTSLTLKLADNSTVHVAKDDLVKRETAPSSMPDVFAQTLTKAELRDLVEYLASLGSKAAEDGARDPVGQAESPREPTPRALQHLSSIP